MAKYIKRGDSIIIPFRNGLSIGDSQRKPRIYSTREAFERHFQAHYLGTDGVELVEFAEVVRCRDCKYSYCNKYCTNEQWKTDGSAVTIEPDDYCSYGERMEPNL